MNALRTISSRVTVPSSFSARLHTALPILTVPRPPRDDGPDTDPTARPVNDGHQKAHPTTVMNQTFPATAPTSDTIVPASMYSAFRNMFDERLLVGIDTVTRDGFVLTNNVQTKGPLIVLNGEAFLWDVEQGKAGMFEGWSVDVLKVFEIIDPKPDIVIFGTGKTFTPVPPKLREYLYGLGIQVDQMDTKNASSTYNVLTEEGRRV
ncbi:hypothetical protein BC937DRAFT_86412, partial [Endogone sp. FLAS-F59071]